MSKTLPLFAKNTGDLILEGEVASVVFSSDTTGFAVIRVDVAEKGQVIAVGNLAGQLPGEWLSMRGKWQYDPNHGAQFKVFSSVCKRPTSKAGLKRYLGSGLVPGIGARLAERLVDELGDGLLPALDGDVAALTAVFGISQKKAEDLIEAWGAAHLEREALVELEGLGFGPIMARRIWEKYGDRTLEQLQSNPYDLVGNIRGVGFIRADGVAQKMGVPKDSAFRAQALVIHLIQEATENGHVCQSLDALEVRGPEFEMPSQLILEAIETLMDQNRLILEDGEYLYLPRLHRAEKEVAERFLSWPEPEAEPLGVDDAIDEIQRTLNLALGDEQRDAVARALSEPLLVITGGPGTGKTTLVRALVALFAEIPGGILLGSPTGRAAKRLTEVTGKKASTLHRLLEATPVGFSRDQSRPLEAGVILVDEASMIDLPLFHALLSGIRVGARLILIGDADQLPPVGPGEVFRDLVETQAVPLVRLKKLYRQDATTLIASNARRVLGGLEPEILRGAQAKSANFFFMEVPPSQVGKVVADLVSHRLPKAYGYHPLKEIQVLTPSHKGEAGTQALNRLLQSTFSDENAPTIALKNQGVLGVGDRIMQTRNNYNLELFNGDIGEVEALHDAENKKGKEVICRFDERELQLSEKDLQDISLAYAITVHKAQGCEYPVVVIPIVSHHTALLSRNLIYTAITRAKALVVLVGSWRVLLKGIARRGPGHRHSRLRQRLRPD